MTSRGPRKFEVSRGRQVITASVVLFGTSAEGLEAGLPNLNPLALTASVGPFAVSLLVSRVLGTKEDARV